MESEDAGETGAFHHRSYHEQYADIFREAVRSDRWCNESDGVTSLVFESALDQIECVSAYDQAWWCSREWLWPQRIECSELDSLSWECRADKSWLVTTNNAIGIDCDTLNHDSVFCPSPEECIGAFDLTPLINTVILNVVWILAILILSIIFASLLSPSKKHRNKKER